jgi:hypothetical protein
MVGWVSSKLPIVRKAGQFQSAVDSADIQTQSFDSEIGANSPSSDGLISMDTRMGRGAGLPARTVPKRACDVRTSICFPGKPETG